MSVAVMEAYASILDQTPQRRFVVAGLIGRLYRSMNAMGTVLLVAQHSDSYTLAATVAGAAVVGTGLGTPTWSRLADSRGQTTILPINLAMTAVSLVTLVAVVGTAAPVWTWFVASFAVGACAADFGTLVRARWASLTSDPIKRHSAMALETVMDELSFVIGPALVAGLSAAIGAETALLIAVAAALVGGFGLWSRPETAPPVATRVGPAVQVGRRILPRGVAPLLGLYVGVGMLFTSVEVSTVAAAEAAEAAGWAGLIVACFSATSVLAGLLVGPMTASWSAWRRLIVSAVCFAVVVQCWLLVDGLGAVLAVGALAGLVTAPVLVAGMSYLQSHAERHRLTEAMAWPSVALSVGITVGSAMTGALIDTLGPFAGFRVAAAGGVVVGMTAAVIVVIGFIHGRRTASTCEPSHG